MKIEYDKEIDAVYFSLQSKKVHHTEEIREGINIDFDDNGNFIGLEILDVTEKYSLSDVFNLSTENLILGPSPPDASKEIA